MIDRCPVMFDSGVSHSILLCKNYFVQENKTPESTQKLGRLANGLSINGKRRVE